MAKKVNALVPSERDRDCEHGHLRYMGLMPCTGPVRCSMCNTDLLDMPHDELNERQLAWQYNEIRKNRFFRDRVFAL